VSQPCAPAVGLSVARRRSRVWRPRSPALNHDLSDSLLAPRAFGPFRVLHQIGVGVLGPVYRAQAEADGLLVAIKALRLDVPPEQAAEIADALVPLAMAWPRQAGLTEVIAAGFEGETPWLALRHLESPTLDTWLREGRRTRGGAALEGLVTLADAIDAAHSHDIVHGSLHPRDVFVDEQGATRVTGFGIAQILLRAGVRPPVRRPYTAPEALDTAALTPSADLFALGVLAFEWLTGRRPAGFGAEAAAHFDLPSSADSLDDARTILAAMLAENPSHRPASAGAFARALAHALTGVEIAPPGAIERPAPEDAPPPSEDALRLFATQGTLWEAPRASEAWRDAELERLPDADAPEPFVAETPDTITDLPPGDEPIVVFVDPPEHAAPISFGGSGQASGRSAGRSAADDTIISTPNDDTIIEGGVLGLRGAPPPPRGHEPERYDASTASASLASEPTAAPRPSAAAAEPPPDSAPAGVVLMLTLALGLAVGGAGGYLLGQRSASRARELAAVNVPPPVDEPRLPTDATGSTPPLAGETPPVVSEGAPSSVSPSPATQSPTAQSPTGRAASASSTTAAPPAPTRARPANASGELVVRSMPARAAVVVNNTWRGRTPLTLRGLAFGTHTVRVVEKGYAAETRRVSLDARVPAATVSVQLAREAPARAAAAATPAPKPGATTGGLYIESRPVGARVFVDGRLVGTTPLLVSELAPGPRAIRLEHAGHNPWTTTMAIVAGQRHRVAASLEEGPP
jgi:serine/threonine protein kinase